MSDRPQGWLARKRRKWKIKLAEKANDSPLLRLLLFKFWFRLAFFGFLLLALVMTLMIPKVWRTSPPGFEPIVTVRALDLVQAWSLKRSAQKALAAGQIDEAIHAWNGAVHNNPGTPVAIRGMLSTLLKGGEPKKYTETAVGQSFWLLRLTKTNIMDAELVTQLYEKYRLDELTMGLLDAMQDRLNPLLEARYVKALFNQGQLYLFNFRWERGRKQFEQDPELSLYMAAYEAGWGPEKTVAHGREQLRAAESDPARRALANRLQLAVSLHLVDAASYLQALQQLVEQRADAALDHVNYWRLLAFTGRKAEAVQKAQAYADKPASAAEVIALANGYTALGLRDLAFQLLQRYTPDFDYSAGVWMTHAELLIAERQWDALLALALQIRQDNKARVFLPGYAYYLEGRAALGQTRQADAVNAFQQMVQYEFGSPVLGLSVAENVLRLGFPKQANDMLAKMQASLSNNPQYWFLDFAAAFELRDADQLLKAATKLYALNPKDPDVVNNYAAALLVLKRQPEEAVKLTLQVLNRNEETVRMLNQKADTDLIGGVPVSELKRLNLPRLTAAITGAKINHGRALAMNQRTTEAQALLQTIQPEQLNPAETTAYYLAWLEVYLDLRQTDQVRKTLARIDNKWLFANQRDWLDQVRRQVSPASGASASAK